MSTNPFQRATDTPRHLGRRTGLAVAAALCGVLLAACGGHDPATPVSADKLMLSGPASNIIVEIPAGWHQLIDSSNSIIPEMVAPTTCMGSNEVSCATGLARIATLTAASPDAAAATIEQAVTSAPGVTPGPTISQGPGKVGRHDGYRHRFSFSNPGGKLTCEIAAVASGPADPDPQGNREYSVVLVWVSDAPTAPKPDSIDDIIASALVAGGGPST